MSRKRKAPQDDKNPAHLKQQLLVDYSSEVCATDQNDNNKLYLSRTEESTWPRTTRLRGRFHIVVRDYYTVKNAITSIVCSSTGVVKILMSYIPIYAVFRGHKNLNLYNIFPSHFIYLGYNLHGAIAGMTGRLYHGDTRDLCIIWDQRFSLGFTGDDGIHIDSMKHPKSIMNAYACINVEIVDH
jgi:hypothetical protein